MTDFKAALAEFSARQAEREAQAQVELQHLKQAVIPALRQAGIAKVEIRFDGSGDSGAVEEIVCLDAADSALACPETVLDPIPNDRPDEADLADPVLLPAALESLAYPLLCRLGAPHCTAGLDAQGASSRRSLGSAREPV